MYATFMNCLLSICLCLTLFSCSEKTQKTDRLFTVDIESGFSKEQGMNISEVADTTVCISPILVGRRNFIITMAIFI